MEARVEDGMTNKLNSTTLNTKAKELHFPGKGRLGGIHIMQIIHGKSIGKA